MRKTKQNVIPRFFSDRFISTHAFPYTNANDNVKLHCYPLHLPYKMAQTNYSMAPFSHDVYDEMQNQKTVFKKATELLAKMLDR